MLVSAFQASHRFHPEDVGGEQSQGISSRGKIREASAPCVSSINLLLHISARIVVAHTHTLPRLPSCLPSSNRSLLATSFIPLPSHDGGRHPLGSTAQTIRSMTTRSPGC